MAKEFAIPLWIFVTLFTAFPADFSCSDDGHQNPSKVARDSRI